MTAHHNVSGHYVIHGLDAEGVPHTLESDCPETLEEAGKAAFEQTQLGKPWKSAFVFRAEHDGPEPRFVEVTAQAAEAMFPDWLWTYGMDEDVPAWIDRQLERLCINAHLKLRAFRRGEIGVRKVG